MTELVTLRAERAASAAAERRVRRARCAPSASTPTSAPSHAVRDVTLDFPTQRGHGDHRAVGLRQVHLAALPQPDARDGARRARRRARCCFDGQDIYADGVRPDRAAPPHRDGVPAADALPDDVDPRQRRGGPAGAARRTTSAPRRGGRDRRARAAPRGAVGRGEGSPARRAPPGISGGQQQRLCIARALADGAATSCCSTSRPRRSIRSARRRSRSWCTSCAQAMTVIIVTHNMQQAARVSDRTAFMLSRRAGRGARRRASCSPRPRDPRTEAYITGRFG